jgi:hypothetical protein
MRTTVVSRLTKLAAVLGGLLLASLVAAPGADAATNAVKFRVGTQVPVDVFTTNVELGDVNGDGHLDAAVGASAGSIGTQHIRVLAGDGDGGFSELGDLKPQDTNLNALAMGDMNADGKQDLVYAGNGDRSRQARISLGDGRGGFEDPTDAGITTVGTNPGSLSLADVNADGKLDAIVGSAWPPGSNGSASGTVTVVYGDGAGGFISSASYGVGNTPGEISAGDVDGDGDLDLAVARYGSDVALLLQDGNGGFAVSSASTGNETTSDLVLEDLDGDGDLDLASAKPDFYSGGLGVALNEGGGSFGTPTTVGGLRSIYALRAADLDGDGDKDLAAASIYAGSGGTVFVFANDGAGKYSPLTSVTPNPGSSLLAGDLGLGDLDEDGWLDMAALRGNPSGGLISLLSNLPPEVNQPTVVPSPAGTDDTLTADVSASDPNGDAVTLDYQWQRKPSGGGSFADIPGQTGVALDLSVAGHGDPGDEIRVAVTATDGKDPAATVYSEAVRVTGGEPEVSIDAASYSGSEGDEVSVSGSASSPGGDPLSLTWSATPGSGVDAGASCDFADAHAASTTVRCTDDGEWTLTLGASAAGRTVTVSAPLTVENVAPAVGALQLTDTTGTACRTGNTVELAFDVTDAGSNDSSGGTVEWGDGSESSFSGGGFSDGHNYAAGRYTITVRASDDDGGVDARSSAADAVSFLYDTRGFLQPVNTIGSRNGFRIPSTIPLKLEVSDCAGEPVPNLRPDVDLKKVGPGPERIVGEVVSSSNADGGDRMRWDSPLYTYNLSTKRSQFCLTTEPGCSSFDLTEGTYEVKASDPTFAPVNALIKLRKK